MKFLNGRIYNQSGRGSLFNRGGSSIPRFVCFGVLNFKTTGASARAIWLHGYGWVGPGDIVNR